MRVRRRLGRIDEAEIRAVINALFERLEGQKRMAHSSDLSATVVVKG
jgi:hypothetical protein